MELREFVTELQKIENDYFETETVIYGPDSMFVVIRASGYEKSINFDWYSNLLEVLAEAKSAIEEIEAKAELQDISQSLGIDFAKPETDANIPF